MLPSGKPPVPEKPWEGLSFKPGKKVILGIIVVIIIVAVVLGAFFLYPMISNSEGNGTALNTVPTITKNPGTTVIPTKTLKPTATVMYPLLPETAVQRLDYNIHGTGNKP
jgi:flagellar basal body-associated protein FliL